MAEQRKHGTSSLVPVTRTVLGLVGPLWALRDHVVPIGDGRSPGPTAQDQRVAERNSGEE
ncbi:hypothetical protein [Streptomyces sp. CAU 1734]|uniref:hypothetical protein n=1 Tax=Streptomyces sp. CAU 1734 TaxID=3140360 RepID=UPI00326168A2